MQKDNLKPETATDENVLTPVGSLFTSGFSNEINKSLLFN